MIKLKYGDKVRFKWSLGAGAPGVMMILGEDREFGRVVSGEMIANGRDNRKLLGMRCMWFNKLGGVEERVFSTKDLVKLSRDEVKRFETLGFSMDKFTK